MGPDNVSGTPQTAVPTVLLLSPSVGRWGNRLSVTVKSVQCGQLKRICNPAKHTNFMKQ